VAWWLFQNVVATAALALIVAMVCRFSRIGPVARHALWLVVLVKFVTPPLVVWPWAAPDPLQVSALDARPDDRRVAGREGLSDDRWPIDVEGPTGTPDGDVRAPVGASGVSGIEAVAGAWPWLMALWLAGSLGLAAIESIRLVRLARRVRAAGIASPAIEHRVAALSARLGLEAVTVRSIPGGAAPAVWCLGRPQLLWPEALAADASDVCIDGVLLHELAHIKRRDHLVGWVELVAGIVWWWNPLFWFVRSALREQAELACDAWVISTLPSGRRAYAESLLALSGAATPDPMSLAVVGIRASNRRVLERRLVMIMQGRASLRLTRIGLLGLALAGAATMPGWAAASQDPPTPQTAPPAPAVVQTPRPAVPVLRRTTPATTRQVRPPAQSPKPVLVPVQVPPTSRQLHVYVEPVGNLPADGQELVKAFESDRDAIQREVEEKIAARREALVKSLEALQDQYTKAGKLDEALAVRDYLRAMADGRMRYVLRKQVGR